ncbi:hypothetical protein F4782DRAFT_524998 [Xylaria castorea]|nr:hypothetical protein F4782DRAFT_524998 [Xylaria castorea]
MSSKEVNFDCMRAVSTRNTRPRITTSTPSSWLYYKPPPAALVELNNTARYWPLIAAANFKIKGDFVLPLKPQARDRVRNDFERWVQDDNADWEDLYNKSLEEADITMIAVRSMKHATGQADDFTALRLFRLGYMLYIVRTHSAYTLDDLKDVIARDWNFPGDDFKDPNLPNTIRDMVFFPCSLVEQTGKDAIEAFFDDGHNPHVIPDEVQMYLYGFNPDGSGSFPRQSVLDIELTVATMCAETWCTWASRNQCPLPPKRAFFELFGPTAAAGVQRLTRRLRRVSENEKLWEHLCLFYSDVAFLANTDVLTDLASNI